MPLICTANFSIVLPPLIVVRVVDILLLGSCAQTAALLKIRAKAFVISAG